MALQLLNDFQAAQEERSRLYSALSAGFKQYLAEKNEPVYAALMTQITQGMAACSKKVVNIEHQLSSDQVSRPDLAALLRTVQDNEREKLHITVSLQALRTGMALRKERQQAMKAHQEEQAAAGLPAHTCTGHGHCHGQGHACDVQDVDDDEGYVMEAQCDAAVKEALQHLDKCVTNINEVLEELRYAAWELREETA